ncbi:MAG: phosphatidylglycerophosphatase A [Thermodesulfobacteriota bacterium]
MFFASGAGLGYVPFASGTFGSLLGIAFHFLLVALTASLAAQAGVLVLAVLAAIWLAGRAEVLLEDHDSGKIVLDEIVGMAIALLGFAPTLRNVIVLFALFRVLDVLKVWPASWIDRRMTGGSGVVLDDVVSGVYANLLARVIL